MESSQTDPSVLAADTPHTLPCTYTEEDDMETRLAPYAAAMDRLAQEFGYETRTVFTAVAACHGDLEDARRFLLHDFAGMKRLPLSRQELVQRFS